MRWAQVMVRNYAAAGDRHCGRIDLQPTMLTLYTTPVVYLYLDQFRLWCKGKWGRRCMKDCRCCRMWTRNTDLKRGWSRIVA